MDRDRVLKTAEAREAIAWAAAAKPVAPAEERYCPTRDILDARLEHVRQDILRSGTSEETSFLLHAILSEIGGNVFDHNLGQWPDMPGCFLAHGRHNGAHVIAIADRGQGVLRTLQRAFCDITTHDAALRAAFTRRISGRAPERRGNGLKFVRRTLLEDGMDLLFVSGSAAYAIVDRAEAWSEAKTPVPGCLAIVSFLTA